jgi:hypothetical protein
VRDAEISLRQGELSESDDNVGVVPLLHLYGRRRLTERTSLVLDIEGAGSSQGRAVDAAIILEHRPTDDWTLSAGYRTLEGGSDGDEVYTFAWLNYALLSASYVF